VEVVAKGEYGERVLTGKLWKKRRIFTQLEKKGREY